MSVFDAYAEYYDLLYADKDYEGEVDYVHQLITAHYPDASTLLDLGCGTGRHDRIFAQRGFEVTGVDQSSRMIDAARTRTKAAERINFVEGDVREVRLDRQYDMVIALFHVVSYQQTNADLQAMFKTVYHHLAPKGLFIFDCWYGPAVLTVRPSVRVKRLENETVRITRIAEPKMHANVNLVDVNYTVFVEKKASGRIEKIEENHKMRYLFAPELEHLLSTCNLKVLTYEEWMTGQKAGFDTWSVTFIAQPT